MSRFNAKKLGFLAAGITTLALFAAQGCSSSGDDSQATPTAGAGGGHAGSAGKSGAGAGNVGDSGATNNNGGSGNTGNTDAGAGGTGDVTGGDAGAAGTPPVDPGCVGADGCYSCAPKTSSQFLNACVAGGCPAHFDNTTLTKLNLVGTL
ncbi:MAG TPA: hypothetical protein VIK01_01175 [Polyangiaceae bacterium]